MVERCQDAEEKEEAIDLARLFLSPRIERLKQWVSATGEKSEADLDRVFAHLRRRFTSYLSPQFREAQCRLMFLVLRLGDLAQFERKQEGERGCKDSPIAHETHFRHGNPTIELLWQLFRRNPQPSEDVCLSG